MGKTTLRINSEDCSAIGFFRKSSVLKVTPLNSARAEGAAPGAVCSGAPHLLAGSLEQNLGLLHPNAPSHPQSSGNEERRSTCWHSLYCLGGKVSLRSSTLARETLPRVLQWDFSHREALNVEPQGRASKQCGVVNQKPRRRLQWKVRFE